MPQIRSLTILVLVLLLPAASIAAAKTMEGTVAYVVDGDTAVLEDGTTVHYAGVEAPSYASKGASEPYGRESFDLNKKLVAGKRIRLETDVRERDDKGAVLAYVYVGRYFINATLLQSGYARAAVRSPNTRFAGLFEKLQAEARQQKKGLWKVPRAASPTFGNADLAKAPEGAPKGAVLTNQDLEKYDIPGEPEYVPEEEAEGDEEGAEGTEEGEEKPEGAEVKPPAKPDKEADAPAPVPPRKEK